MKCNGGSMLIVGQIYDEDERDEALFVADVFTIGQKFRKLARKNRKK
jgi:hypothetical protein